MSRVDTRISELKEKLTQLERQKRAQEAREKKNQFAINRERHRIIGELVEAQFPEVSRFTPHRTNAENQSEFATLIHFLYILAAHETFMKYCKNYAAKRTSAEISKGNK
jgi:hypothetical protein